MNYFLRLLIVVIFCLRAAALVAQTDAESRRVVIEAFYPALIQAAKDADYNRARILSHQAIEWEPDQPVHRYNLACIEAKAGVPDKAFEALTMAAALGYSDVESLKTDPDFESIRADQRFKDLITLVQSIAAKNQPAPAAPTPSPAPVATKPPAAATPRAEPVAPVAPVQLPKEVIPPAAKVVNGKPVGLFFMTRFWSFTGTLEKIVWYFSPEGEIYQNLQDGFSPDDLAAHKGKKGTFKMVGDKMEVTWSDKKVTASHFEREPTDPGFAWDGGIFTPVEPFGDPKKIVGKYEGGESLSRGGNYAAFSRTLDLRADGTFSRESVGSVVSQTSESTVSGGSTGGGGGTWKLSPYSLTLIEKDGKVTRKIAFPYDDEKTPVYPDRFFFGGTMYKHQ